MPYYTTIKPPQCGKIYEGEWVEVDAKTLIGAKRKAKKMHEGGYLQWYMYVVESDVEVMPEYLDYMPAHTCRIGGHDRWHDPYKWAR